MDILNDYLKDGLGIQFFETDVIPNDGTESKRKQGVSGEIFEMGSQVWLWFCLFLLDNKTAVEHFTAVMEAYSVGSHIALPKKLKQFYIYLITQYNHIYGATFEVILGICLWLYHQFGYGFSDSDYTANGPLTYSERNVSYSEIGRFFNQISSSQEALDEINLHYPYEYKCTYILYNLVHNSCLEKGKGTEDE